MVHLWLGPCSWEGGLGQVQKEQGRGQQKIRCLILIFVHGATFPVHQEMCEYWSQPNPVGLICWGMACYIRTRSVESQVVQKVEALQSVAT